VKLDRRVLLTSNPNTFRRTIKSNYAMARTCEQTGQIAVPAAEIDNALALASREQARNRWNEPAVSIGCRGVRPMVISRHC
jgi:hypothetical protein